MPGLGSGLGLRHFKVLVEGRGFTWQDLRVALEPTAEVV